MVRTGLLVALALVLVLGVPIVLVLADGGDGDDDDRVSRDEVIAESTYPEGIPDDAASQRREPKEAPGRARGGGRGGPRAVEFDEAMEGVGYPAEISPSAEPAVRAVERVLGRESGPGEQTVVAADCRDGTCTIRYRSQPRGGGIVAERQATIVRRLFRRDDVRKVVLYVHHKHTGQRKEERPAFNTLTCARRAQPGFDWERLGPRNLSRRCEGRRLPGGKLRNQVRRGHVSVEEASNAQAATGSPGGGSAPGPEGARPPGPAPESVRGTRQAERKARSRRDGGSRGG